MPTIQKGKRPVWAGERKEFDRIAKANQAFYNSAAWRNTAAAHKAMQHYKCINHKTCKGSADITDHIIPINEGGALFDFDNLQSLCKRCNAVKTGKQAHKSPHRGE